MGDCSSLLGCLRVRCLATLMDRLGRRGGLFLEWASVAFGDGEWHGRGELPDDNSSSARRSISFGIAATLSFPGREGGKGRGGSRDRSAWLASKWVRRRSFLPATGSPVSAVRTPAWPAHLVLPLVLNAKGGIGLRGLGSWDC